MKQENVMNKMKKTIRCIFAVALMASFNANAALVSIADVAQQESEGLDSIIAYDSLRNSGDATERAWMTQSLEEFYGHSFDPISTITRLEFEDDTAVDDFWGDPVGTDSMGGDIHSGSMVNEPVHYLVKIGGGRASYDTFLYRNVGDLALATIGLGWMEHFSDFTGNNFDVYRISHVSAVPVPAALWLFGTALIGFIGFSRRTKV